MSHIILVTNEPCEEHKEKGVLTRTDCLLCAVKEHDALVGWTPRDGGTLSEIKTRQEARKKFMEFMSLNDKNMYDDVQYLLNRLDAAERVAVVFATKVGHKIKGE